MNNHMCDCNNSAGSFMGGMLIGVLVGGALGLLYAPQSGKETRKFLRDKAMDVKDKVVEGIDTAKEEAIEFKQKATRAVRAAEKEFKKA